MSHVLLLERLSLRLLVQPYELMKSKCKIYRMLKLEVSQVHLHCRAQ